MRRFFNSNIMDSKKSQIKEQVPDTVAEPKADEVRKKPVHIDPNKPFHGTREEWEAYVQAIEQGEFMPLDEYYQKFDAWKNDYFAKKSKIKAKRT